MNNENNTVVESKFLQYFKSLYKDAEFAGSYYAIIEYFGKLDKKKSKVLDLSSFSWSIINEALNTDFIITVSRIYDFDDKFRPKSDINLLNFLNFINQNFEKLFAYEVVIRRNDIDSNSKWKLERIPILDKKDVINDLLQLEKFKENIIALKYFRDKSYAHSDFEFLIENQGKFKRPRITYNQINDLLKFSISILLKYRLSFDGANFVFPASNLNDMHNTIDLLYSIYNN